MRRDMRSIAVKQIAWLAISGNNAGASNFRSLNAL